MDTGSSKTFKCTLISPVGRLLDCAATAVTLPAHDGQVGILYDHMPMLCQLGIGLLKVAEAPSDAGQGSSSAPSSFFIDGGFALVAMNSLMVVAYEAVSLRESRSETIKALTDKAARNVEDAAVPTKQKAHETERLRVLMRIAGTDQTLGQG